MKIKEIHFKVIPHKKQRYETSGDWFMKDGILEIRVSDLGNPWYNYILGRHEMDEAMLCMKRGISEKVVMDFDLSHLKSPDPGWEEDAPYRKEHIYAETGERLMCAEMDIDWTEYEKAVQKLYE